MYALIMLNRNYIGDDPLQGVIPDGVYMKEMLESYHVKHVTTKIDHHCVIFLACG